MPKQQINNYLIELSQTIAIYPPEDMVEKQKKLGVKVIQEYTTDYYTGFRRHITIKELYYQLNYLLNKNIIRTAIVYDDPDTDNFINSVTTYLLNRGVLIFYRSRQNCKMKNTVFTEITAEHKHYYQKQKLNSTFDGTEAYKDYEVISEEDKAKLKSFIKDHEYPYPEDERQWYCIKLTFDFISAKLKEMNIASDDEAREVNLGSTYEKSHYEVCPECGERYSYFSLHECYVPETYKRTKLDILVNGDER